MEVQLWKISYLSGERRWLNMGSSVATNAAGRYRLKDIVPDRYYLSVRPLESPSNKQSNDERFVRSYYPGTIYSDAAVPIDLNPGIELPNVSMKLKKAATVHVSGTVHNGKGADVYLTPDTILFDTRFTTQSALAGGKFEFSGILPGSYRLRARLKKEDKSEEWASRWITV